MTLTSGSRLGPYEIVSPLGAGGMGEVYRAKDTRLDRQAAMDTLSERGPGNYRERRPRPRLSYPPDGGQVLQVGLISLP